jgi:hypothetical protein
VGRKDSNQEQQNEQALATLAVGAGDKRYRLRVSGWACLIQ